MRKKSLIFTAVVGILLFLTSCSSTRDITKTTGISISGGEILQEMETHGGFRGEGMTFIEIKFPEEEVAEIISIVKANKAWRTLPLSDSLQAIAYGRNEGNHYWSPYALDREGNLLFPQIEHGYYFFYDRHDESTDALDDTDILNRYSQNFSMAIFDTDKNKLYYFKMDT